MLGGNGYIGRNVIKQWLQRDGQAQFYVLDLFPNYAISKLQMAGMRVKRSEKRRSRLR